MWGKWEQNVIRFVREWNILCYAYKWKGERTVKVVGLPDFPGRYRKDRFDDEVLMHELWKLLDEADVVVAHNAKQFDVRKINARFFKFHLTPPSPYRVVDTKITAKAKLALNSNSLDDICEYLGYGKKIKTDFDLWLGCMNRDPVSWAKMYRYNKRDVVLLEKVYNDLLPWDDYHPNISLPSGKGSLCPRCGSANVEWRGWTNLKSWRCRRYVCNKCGRWSQGAREKLPFNVLN